MMLIKRFFCACLVTFILSLFSPAIFAEPSFRFNVHVGSPYLYPMELDKGGNYFLNSYNKIYFVFFQKSSLMSYWGNGQDVRVVETKDLNNAPYSINLRWFSPIENQFWEVQHIFNDEIPYQEMRASLNDYMVFTVYLGSQGEVTIWGAFGSVQLFITQFKAHKMVNEPNWDDFYKRALAKRYGGMVIPRDQFIEKVKSFAGLKTYAQRIESGEIGLLVDPWLENTKSYVWSMQFSDNLKSKKSVIYTLQGERFVVNAKTNARLKAPPIAIESDFKVNTGPDFQLSIAIDSQEVQQVFQQLAQNGAKEIVLRLVSDDALKQFKLEASANGKTIRLNKIAVTDKGINR